MLRIGSAAACVHVAPAHVLGPGRVGRALSAMASPPLPLLARSDTLPISPEGAPLWVATPSSALPDVLARAAAEGGSNLVQRLVLVQNGMLLPLLQSANVDGAVTQVLLYAAGASDCALYCSAMQCSAVQCSAVQCSAVQCSAVQCSAVQCSAVQCSAVQCSAVQHFWKHSVAKHVNPVAGTCQ